MENNKEFSDLKIPKVSLSENSQDHYRVYKNSKEFVTIQAGSASEAIEKAAIEKPFKILYVINEAEGFLDQSQIIRQAEEPKAAAEENGQPSSAPPAESGTPS
jgi:hypothetical protein